MSDKAQDLLRRTMHLSEVLGRGREFVDAGVMSEAKYEAISDAIHDFQDGIIERLRGTMTEEELRARADLVQELLQ